jgi:hypothetical protein
MRYNTRIMIPLRAINKAGFQHSYQRKTDSILVWRSLMNRDLLRLTVLMGLGMLVYAATSLGNTDLKDPYTPEEILGAVTDTIPLNERFGNFLTDPSTNPFDLQDPSIIEQNVEYDPETGNYLITEKIGDDFFRMPSYLTFEEYVELQSKKQEQAYFNELSGISTGESSGSGRPDPIAQFDIQNSLIDRLFGERRLISVPRGILISPLGWIFKMSKTLRFWNDSVGKEGLTSTWPFKRMCRVRSGKS